MSTKPTGNAPRVPNPSSSTSFAKKKTQGQTATETKTNQVVSAIPKNTSKPANDPAKIKTSPPESTKSVSKVASASSSTLPSSQKASNLNSRSSSATPQTVAVSRPSAASFTSSASPLTSSSATSLSSIPNATLFSNPNKAADESKGAETSINSIILTPAPTGSNSPEINTPTEPARSSTSEFTHTFDMLKGLNTRPPSPPGSKSFYLPAYIWAQGQERPDPNNK